ncbi:MAG: DUF1223 domain-containing protein [Casimicrobiaceae bacterium]
MTILLRGIMVAAVCIAASGSAPFARAAVCEAGSGAKVLPLVELYTSEGCDSCPPADRWLSARFPVAPAAPQASVLTFHVDYWDRLGWKDRFASAQFTARQYASSRAGGETFVYTPQVRVQGRDMQNWASNKVAESLGMARGRAARAEVKLAVDATADAMDVRIDVRVPDIAEARRAEVWLAYTDSRLVSDVKAGENKGVRLEHDHVVRILAGPFVPDAQGRLDKSVHIARPAERGRGPTLVAVVQDARNGEVLQTLSLPVCGSQGL